MENQEKLEEMKDVKVEKKDEKLDAEKVQEIVKKAKAKGKITYEELAKELENTNPDQIDKVFDLLCDCLISDGHICFVIGRSIIKGREINNAELITDIALKHGLSLVADIEREIASSKKSFNLIFFFRSISNFSKVSRNNNKSSNDHLPPASR